MNSLIALFFEDAWRWKCGLPERQRYKRLPSLESLKKTEQSKEFHTHCLNRKIMGALRYGLMGSVGKVKYDRLDSIVVRAKKYKETGNDDLLFDIANMAELEYVEGSHPLKHLDGGDSKSVGHTKEIQ